MGRKSTLFFRSRDVSDEVMEKLEERWERQPCSASRLDALENVAVRFMDAPCAKKGLLLPFPIAARPLERPVLPLPSAPFAPRRLADNAPPAAL